MRGALKETSELKSFCSRALGRDCANPCVTCNPRFEHASDTALEVLANNYRAREGGKQV